MTVSRQYSAHGEPPWYSGVSALAVTPARLDQRGEKVVTGGYKLTALMR